MTYESWRITYQDAEQAARSAWQMAQEAEQSAVTIKSERDRLSTAHSVEMERADIAEQRAAQAEREAVLECERIAREERLKHQAYNDDRLLIVGFDGMFRAKWPQHFKGE